MEFTKPYIDNRELSWLKFNRRVLEEAQNNAVPLFERLRFVYIFNNNLDEFFMVRVGYLRESMSVKKEEIDNKTNLTAWQQLKYISKSVKELVPMRDKVYKEIKKKLRKAGLVKIDLSDGLSARDEVFLEDYFKKEVLPLLTPSIIDIRHPVPFLRNREIYISTMLESKGSSERVLGIIPASQSDVLERIIWLPPDEDGSLRFVLLEHLIVRYADLIFDNFRIVERSIFRITRNADITANEALFDFDYDFREIMEDILKRRKKSAPVRIEFDTSVDHSKEMGSNVAQQLNLKLSEDYIYTQSAPLDLSFIFELEGKLKSHGDIFFETLRPQNSPLVDMEKPVMAQIEKGDIILSYPYESVKPFIRLLEEAAVDEYVHSIKITLYRLASDSKIIDALITAAENGKHVLTLLELRARFDEENNINWSKRLEDAGAQVIYGLDELKVHSKLLLITKKIGEEQSVRYYTQIGTGNYNEKTSRLYTDLSLMTANKDIGTDASIVFNALSQGLTAESTNLLWVAPRCLKSRVVEAIDTEITRGDDGYIGLKLNSLTDKDIIEKLVEASRNGVTVELLIRGICCLVAGVEGYTENVRVTSIVGRFLEHSRIYIFGKNEQARVYISSADFMTRNTERRVEVAAPILDPALKESTINNFNTMMSDNVKARIQDVKGDYNLVKHENVHALNSQIYFYERAYAAARLAEDRLNSQEKRVVGDKNKNEGKTHFRFLGFLKRVFGK